MWYKCKEKAIASTAYVSAGSPNILHHVYIYKCRPDSKRELSVRNSKPNSFPEVVQNKVACKSVKTWCFVVVKRNLCPLMAYKEISCRIINPRQFIL